MHAKLSHTVWYFSMPPDVQRGLDLVGACCTNSSVDVCCIQVSPALFAPDDANKKNLDPTHSAEGGLRVKPPGEGERNGRCLWRSPLPFPYTWYLCFPIVEH